MYLEILGQDKIVSALIGIITGFLTYMATRYMNTRSMRKDQTDLAIATLSEIMEELNIGYGLITGTLDRKYLPHKTYFGMKTISDDSFLRITKSFEKHGPNVTYDFFPMNEIRTHIKNYFEHMVPNWNNETKNIYSGLYSTNQSVATYMKANFKDYKVYLEASTKLISTLDLAIKALKRNKKSIFPK